MSRWPRRPTSLWVVDRLIASPTMTNASTHSPSALSPLSNALQYRLSTSPNFRKKWSILAYAKDLFACAQSILFGLCISQAENVSFGMSFVEQISAIALPLLLILTCLVDALFLPNTFQCHTHCAGCTVLLSGRQLCFLHEDSLG